MVVETDHPILKILRKPDLARRMVGWAVELSEFGLRYGLPQGLPNNHWNLYVDDASGRVDGGARVVLEGPGGFFVEQSLNQVEYEDLIVGLQLTRDMGARPLTCWTDFKLVVGQMNGEFQVKDDHHLKYFHKASALVEEFEQVASTFRKKRTSGQTCYLNLVAERVDDHHLAGTIRDVSGMFYDKQPLGGRLVDRNS